MIKNFFRPDLKLQNKWWHRLFIILFISAIAFYGYIFFEDNVYIPGYKNIGSISSRIPSTPTQLDILVHSGEYFEHTDSSFAINTHGYNNNEFFRSRAFCSKTLFNQLGELKNITGIENFSISKGSNYSFVKDDEFSTYLRSNNIQCVLIDSFTGGKAPDVYWIEPAPELVFNYSLFVESFEVTAEYIIKELFLVFLIATGVIVFYYKIVLYIIFGNKKQ